ncbi:MAG: alkaline phosphatase family protein [Nitrososphaerota archaeon]|nr:alkaline phosphatase family protein [Nitrososphaerota archaeon]
MSRSKSERKPLDAKFVKPRYDGQSIANVPETVAKFLGARSNRTLKHPGVDELDSKHIVLLLLDGLGTKLVQSARHAFSLPSYEKICSNALQFNITSVFPSTTATAMSSLHSGLTPQEHGVIGYTMYLRELGLIGQMLRFSPMAGGRSLFDVGLDRSKFLGGQTIHERLDDEGIDSTVYVPHYIIDSGLSQITYRGAFVEAQNSVADMVVRLRKNLEQGKEKSFHFAYHPSPDTLAHGRGPYSEEYAVEIESIFSIVESQLLQKLDRKVARDTLLIITGDHGAVNIEKEGIIDLSNHPKLLDLLKLPPTGDSRACIMHAKEGMEKKIREYFKQNFKDLFEVRSSKWFLENGYFGLGKVRQETYDRIGDVIAVPESYNVIDNSTSDPKRNLIPGRHGGLSEEEMNVPCIMAKLD